MNKTQIDCFLEAAKTLSFTKAAKNLYITQQAVSKQIMNLEAELGVSLFLRSSTGLILTEAGCAYNSLFCRQYENFQRVLFEVRDQNKKMGSRLRIGYSVWLDPYGELDRALTAFRKTHPNIMFRAVCFHNNELINELKNDRLDVVIVSGGQVIPDVELAYTNIASEQFCLYAPDWIADETVDPECWGLPFLCAPSWNWNYLLQKRLFAVESQVSGENFGIAPKSYRMLPNLQSMMAELSMGKYVTLGDSRFSCISKTPGVKAYPLSGGRPQLCCVWVPTNENPLIRQYTDFLTDYLSEGHTSDEPELISPTET